MQNITKHEQELNFLVLNENKNFVKIKNLFNELKRNKYRRGIFFLFNKK